MSSMRSNNSDNVSYIFGILTIILLFILYLIVYFIDVSLPTPLTIEDEINNQNSFIAESAKCYLKLLTDLGPRVVGDKQNEIFSVQRLQDEIYKIRNNAHPNQMIEYDLQLTTGSYYLAYKPYGSINAYANLQNVIVKVHSKNNSENSVLINAHFDTMPRSPGANDDGIHCAVMLEVLRKLSQSSAKPLNNIVFLFNGGEESNIQASHGFIAQHKWAHEVKVVINLEATGGGGKEILFQAGPGQAWLMNYYANVPHPFAHVAGEEVFKSNIIPSDSDFRIFRDFGGIIGYDFAYIKDGYRYHTKYDDFSSVVDGRIQHTGDNILQLVRDLANAPEVNNNAKEENGGVVFYDFIGLFLIYYSENVGIIVNTLVIIISYAVAAWSVIDFKMESSRKSMTYIALTLLGKLTGWIFSAVFVLLVALILGAVNRTMSWYNVPVIVVGLYFLPVLGCCCATTMLVNHYVKNKDLNLAQKILLQIHLVRSLWTTVALVGTCLGIMSVYIIIVPVLFNAVAAVIIHIFKLYSSKLWIPIYLVSTVLPTMFIMYLGHVILSLFIPLCGRFGTAMNPEFIIGLFLVAFAILVTCLYEPLLLLINKPGNILFFIGAFFIATVIVIATPMGFPYNGDNESPNPQRFPIYHTRRIYHDESGDVIKDDAGFYFRNMDYNSPRSIKPYVTEMQNATSLEDDCKRALFCGLPVTYSRDFEELEDNVWIPAKAPIIEDTMPSLTLNYVETLSSTLLRYSFKVTGPDCMDVYLSPKENARIAAVSLNNFVPTEQPTWNGRPTVYILYVYGKLSAPLNFHIDIEVPNNWSEPVIDIAITGKYIHDESTPRTEEFENFLKKFPDWAVFTTIALGHYESWVY